MLDRRRSTRAALCAAIACAGTSPLLLAKPPDLRPAHRPAVVDRAARAESHGAFDAPDCPCTADLNLDQTVDANDLALILGAWGTPDFDLTGDGDVAAADLALVLGAWGPCPVPSNDHCGTATPLGELGTMSIPFCTIGATSAGPDLPDELGCNIAGSHTIVEDIWYSLTVSSGGGRGIKLETCDSSFDTKIALYSIWPGADCTAPYTLSPLACNDDIGSICPTNPYSSQLYAALPIDGEYLIRLGGYNSAGPGTLAITTYPPHDLCLSAKVFWQGCETTCTNSFLLDSTGATDEPAVVPTSCAGELDLSDVWIYGMFECLGRPDAAVPVTVSTCNDATSFDTVLTVFEGPDCDHLTEVACNDDVQSADPACVLPPNGYVLKSRIEFIAQPSTFYWIRVSGYGGATGTVQVDVTSTCN